MGHTPGPWRWEDRDTLINDKCGILRTNVFPNNADANLIAAAPAMYEACKEVERLLMVGEDWRKPLRIVRAAIAAAEGVKTGEQP